MRSLLFALLAFAPAAFAQTPTPSPAATPAPAESPAPTPAATPEATPAATATPAAASTPAPTPTPEPTPVWKGSLEAGATRTSGNTDIQTETAALKLDGAWRGWGVAVRSSGVHAETEDVQTAGAWDASVRGDRVIIGKLGSYLKFSIDGDRFKGIENRKGVGAGLSAAHKWTADGGWDRAAIRGELGYQFFREDRVAIEEHNDISAARAFAGILLASSKDMQLTEEAEVLYDFATEDRFLFTSVTALSVKIRKNLALKVSETIKRDTKPAPIDPVGDPEGKRFEETDTLTAIALILSF